MGNVSPPYKVFTRRVLLTIDKILKFSSCFTPTKKIGCKIYNTILILNTFYIILQKKCLIITAAYKLSPKN